MCEFLGQSDRYIYIYINSQSNRATDFKIEILKRNVKEIGLSGNVFWGTSRMSETAVTAGRDLLALVPVEA